MANSLLTIDMITRKSLAILENNLVLSRNINRQYDDSFAVEGPRSAHRCVSACLIAFWLPTVPPCKRRMTTSSTPP